MMVLMGIDKMLSVFPLSVLRPKAGRRTRLASLQKVVGDISKGCEAPAQRIRVPFGPRENVNPVSRQFAMTCGEGNPEVSPPRGRSYVTRKELRVQRSGRGGAVCAQK